MNTIKLLTLADADELQHLYERCHDYSLLEQGIPFAPDAARIEFATVPEGKTTADKFLLALSAPTGELVGIIECIRGYPDTDIWWLGLMLLAPAHRGQGIGTHFDRLFERWAAAQGAKHISLAVLEENTAASRFWQKIGFTRIHTTPSLRH